MVSDCIIRRRMSQRRGLCCRMVERKILGSKATESAPVVLYELQNQRDCLAKLIARHLYFFGSQPHQNLMRNYSNHCNHQPPPPNLYLKLEKGLINEDQLFGRHLTRKRLPCNAEFLTLWAYSLTLLTSCSSFTQGPRNGRLMDRDIPLLFQKTC